MRLTGGKWFLLQFYRAFPWKDLYLGMSSGSLLSFCFPQGRLWAAGSDNAPEGPDPAAHIYPLSNSCHPEPRLGDSAGAREEPLCCPGHCCPCTPLTFWTHACRRTGLMPTLLQPGGYTPDRQRLYCLPRACLPAVSSCLQGKAVHKAIFWGSVKWAMFSSQQFGYPTHSLSASFLLTVYSVAGQISHHCEYTQLYQLL